MARRFDLRTWLAAVVLATCLFPASAYAWWQKDWPYRTQVTIDTTPKGVEVRDAIGRFPLLIRLHTGNFHFEDAQENGADLRFVSADDKTPMTYHIESFDPLVGVATVWVDVPEMPARATKTFWMYYGNKTAAAAVDTAASFDPNYALVYHFDAAAGAPPKDKTAYKSDAQTAPGAVDDGSIIGKGARFTGTGSVVVASNPALATKPGGGFTFSAWVKPDAPQARAGLFVRGQGAGGLVVGLDQGAPFFEAAGARIAAAQPLAKGTWSHVAVTADGKAITLYVNGKQAGIAPGALPALDGPIALGGDLPGGSGLAGYIGGMDEARVSKIARSPALILADAASQGAESRLTAFGADEKRSGIGFGLFGVIVKSVDGTAWVIIALLGVLGAASWWIMYTKITYANACDKADGLFLKLFEEHGADPLALTDPAIATPDIQRRFDQSPIYRVYRAGARELGRREKNGYIVLRSDGIEVVRARMDGTMVRENQRLSRGTVVLTIAISGGPFIGLLGTVMGVMITFAAIAAAGDVNVNAIAPGISAALLATVAGLAVAIPALFAYNYILLRNKVITANMQVFGDEFLTVSAEIYGDANHALAAE